MRIGSPYFLQSASHIFRFTPPEDDYVKATVTEDRLLFVVTSNAPVVNIAYHSNGRWNVAEIPTDGATKTVTLSDLDLGTDFYLWGKGADAYLTFKRDMGKSGVSDFYIKGDFCKSFTGGIQYGYGVGNVHANSSSLTDISITSQGSCKQFVAEDCPALTSIIIGAMAYNSEDGLETVIITDCPAGLTLGINPSTTNGLKNLTFLRNTGAMSYRSANAIKTIRFNAVNEAAANSVASMITNADANDGTVYLNSADAYYQTVADAATAKGWTIGSL